VSWWGDHGCDRLAIVGLGQIGASFGLAARASSAASRVCGYDVNPDAGRTALETGAVTDLAETVEEAVTRADLVLLAAPVLEIVRLVGMLAPYLGPRCVLTDAGSAKEAVVAAMEAAPGCNARCVGGHPMAGSERPGPGAARPDLFQGRKWVLCPGPSTRADTLQTLRSFVSALGAVPLIMDAADHDREVAWTSHVPYLSAVGLCLGMAAQKSGGDRWRLIGSGLRDCTRVAASDPVMAASFCISNRNHVAAALRTDLDSLNRILEAVDEGDHQGLLELLGQGRRVREEVIGSCAVPGGLADAAAAVQPAGEGARRADGPGAHAHDSR
jgi:prephenate dehydrogenase